MLFLEIIFQIVSAVRILYFVTPDLLPGTFFNTLILGNFSSFAILRFYILVEWYILWLWLRTLA